ncbi:MAG: L-fucose mutarotase/ribose pyranase (RbsD/FucU family) [Pseudomonadales bacterium]|jgi:L-fucose mutarotase/ribose pyranase (RbsD/FucU family)
MIKAINALLFATIATTFTSMAHAEELIIPITKQAEDVKGIMPTPNQGQSMAAVQSIWGQEIARSKTVGEPPITKLEYADFFVYFENETVIHAVIKYK